MKRLTLIMFIICILVALQTTMAQNWVTTLEHNGATQVFYGQNSFVDAYNISVNGDQIYLSAGNFKAPDKIAKGLKIYGAGHFPIEGKQTITGELRIAKGADSLRLEGICITGGISYGLNETYGVSINYVKIIRCSIYGATYFLSVTNYCTLEECFFNKIISGRNANNLLIRNSIIKDNISTIASSALIERNIFLSNPSSNYYKVISDVNYSIFQNNIFFGEFIFDRYYGTNTNTIKKNIFVSSDPGKGVDKTANYTGIERTSIFVNQSDSIFNNYSYDYHLKSPGTYIGTDGTQVGLYGGLSFKEKGVPSNPYIESKDVALTTETNGNLKINISVKAQDN